MSTGTPKMPPMRQLDEMAGEDFIDALAPLFEGAPGFVARLAADRPFATYDELLDRARTVALAMPEPEQLALIDAHPRLGAPAGSLSALSSVEQGYERDPGASTPSGDRDSGSGEGPERDAADRHSAEEAQAVELERLNAAYEARFGFRFVLFVRGRPRSEIAAILAERLTAERHEEKQRALVDVVSIARDRLRRIGASERWASAPEGQT